MQIFFSVQILFLRENSNVTSCTSISTISTVYRALAKVDAKLTLRSTLPRSIAKYSVFSAVGPIECYGNLALETIIGTFLLKAEIWANFVNLKCRTEGHHQAPKRLL